MPISSLNGILIAANTGLRASQIQLDLVSRNVTNASVDGYTRKDAPLETLVNGISAQGVNAGEIRRNVSSSLLQEIRAGHSIAETMRVKEDYLARLETLLALVEGWVDAVVHEAAKPRLTSADALRETLRRRRASGGPAEQTFATLIGLELRPRRLRDAARLWASLTDARGVDGRDGSIITGGIIFFVAGRCPDGWPAFPGDWTISNSAGTSSISVYACTTP